MEKELSIRERIKSYQNEILSGNLNPDRLSEMLLEITALLGNIGDYITECEMTYNKVLDNFYDAEETANRAKIKADISEEFRAMKQAKTIEKVAIGVERAIKYRLRVMQSEFQAGGAF
jgi:hypothetical protein